MAFVSRTKRVTDPLDDEAKARIFRNHGCILDQDSPRLCELEFLEDDPKDELQTYCDSDLSKNSAMECSSEASEEIVRMDVSYSDYDPYRNVLLAHVSRVVEAYSCFRSHQKSIFRDKVATFLRELGHDAAVCVSEWNSSVKLTSGSYDFIDVVYKPADDQTAVRYFVVLDFASEFEIAMPTHQYARVWQLLPHAFVGKEESQRTILRVACNAAKRSLKSCGLSLPPWWRISFLQHKWFGPHTRWPGGTSFEVKQLNKDAVSCRSVGLMTPSTPIWSSGRDPIHVVSTSI